MFFPRAGRREESWGTAWILCSQRLNVGIEKMRPDLFAKCTLRSPLAYLSREVPVKRRNLANRRRENFCDRLKQVAEFRRFHVPLQHRDVRSVFAIQLEALWVALENPGIGRLGVLEHRVVGLKESVDGRDVVDWELSKVTM
jgi:hypothetical protein